MSSSSALKRTAILVASGAILAGAAFIAFSLSPNNRVSATQPPVCPGYTVGSPEYQDCVFQYSIYSAKSNLPALDTSPHGAAGLDTDPTPVPSSPDVGTSDEIAAVQTAAVADLTGFDLAQVMPADFADRRAAVTTNLAATETRIRNLLSDVVVPTELDTTANELDEAYQFTGLDPNSPSLLDARYTVTQWQGVQVNGDSATATFVASEGLKFSDDPTAWNDDTPEQYVVQLSLVNGSWLMSSHTATSLEDVS